MRLNLLAALLATTALATIPTAAEAGGYKYGNHSFGGKVSATWGENSNAAAAPAKAGKSFDDDDDDEDDLGDLLDDAEIDDEDIAETDAEEDDDDDDDGIPDFAEAGTPAQVYRDSKVQYALGVNHGYKFSDRLSWKSAIVAGINRQMDRHELNRRNWAINTGPVFNIKSWNVTINPSVTYLQLNKAHKDQNESTIASLAAKWKINKQWELGARANKEFRNNLRPRTTNINVEAFKLGAVYKPTKKDKFAINWAPKVENNENNIKSKEAWAADIGYARKLPWDMVFGVAYKYDESEFVNGATPRREDEGSTYGVGLGKNFKNGMFVNLGAGYKGKKSNIANKGNHDKSVFVQSGWSF
jgi:hypothetical protein